MPVLLVYTRYFNQPLQVKEVLSDTSIKLGEDVPADYIGVSRWSAADAVLCCVGVPSPPPPQRMGLRDSYKSKKLRNTWETLIERQDGCWRCLLGV